MSTRRRIFIAAVFAAFLAATSLAILGCGTRVELIPPGTPVRLADPAQVFIYVRDPATGQWARGRNAVQAPAGWYLVAPPGGRP